MTDTLYYHVADGQIGEGPVPLPFEWVTDTNTILSFDKIEDPTPYGWLPFVDAPPPDYDVTTLTLVPGLEIDGLTVKRTWTTTAIVVVTPPPTSVDILEAAAVSARFDKMNAGLLFRGMPFPTDSDGRGLVSGAYAKALSDPTLTKRWQISNAPITFVTLDAATIIALGLTFDTYIQSVFDKLDDVAIAINAGTITTPIEIGQAFASVSQVFN